MKIIEPSATLIDDINPAEVMAKLERCGRVSRLSESRGKPEDFIRNIIKRGHESVLEHVSLTFHIICDRAIMAELTRHRLAAFTVESTRYVKYDELTFIKQFDNDVVGEAWTNDVAFQAEENYTDWLCAGAKPEEARAVLPNCLKTELYMTCNLREWRHVLKLRTSRAAHPQMRLIAGQILATFKDKLPVIVEDIT